jgi:quercetin dioxygenase-like cupin family protein
MRWFRQKDLPKKQLTDGIQLSSVWGEGAMLTFFDLADGAVIPLHKHPHEQVSFLLEGELEFTIGNETRVVLPGEGCVIAANEEHAVKVTKGPARALDAWFPLREEYKIQE